MDKKHINVEIVNVMIKSRALKRGNLKSDRVTDEIRQISRIHVVTDLNGEKITD